MEKRISLKAERPRDLFRQTHSPRLLPLFQIILLLTPLFWPQFVPQQLHAQSREPNPLIRIQLWVPTEEEPSRQDTARDGEELYMPALRNLRNIAPFMLEGMLYGWNVTYTPSDAARRIDEYYECTSVTEVSPDDPAIKWTESEITDTTTSCWVEYTRSDTQMQYRKWWSSVNIVKIQGKGSASITLGPEGIKQAVTDAAKTAIRAYLQKTEKNKPKEMTGSILLADESPRIYIDHGQYVADLDFFLYVDKIDRYSYY